VLLLLLAPIQLAMAALVFDGTFDVRRKTARDEALEQAKNRLLGIGGGVAAKDAPGSPSSSSSGAGGRAGTAPKKGKEPLTQSNPVAAKMEEAGVHIPYAARLAAMTKPQVDSFAERLGLDEGTVLDVAEDEDDPKAFLTGHILRKLDMLRTEKFALLKKGAREDHKLSAEQIKKAHSGAHDKKAAVVQLIFDTIATRVGSPKSVEAACLELLGSKEAGARSASVSAEVRSRHTRALESKALSRTELDIVTLPEGKEEWRNITFPPGGIPGTKLELRHGEKRAIVTLPHMVKEGEKFRVVVDPTAPLDDPALHDERYGNGNGMSGQSVVTLPDGREEWRNITCPEDSLPGTALEVILGEKRAVVTIPDGVKPGEKFDTFAGFTCAKYSAPDMEIVMLPDGGEEWRNITLPPEGRPGMNMEVRQDGKRAFITVPDGVKAGETFNAVATLTNIEPEDVIGIATIDKSINRMEVETLPDGREKWRNVHCPTGGRPGLQVQAELDGPGDKRAIVTIPDGVKEGDLFDAIALSREDAQRIFDKTDKRKAHSTPRPTIDNRKAVHGPEADTRLRLQRKLEQKRQALCSDIWLGPARVKDAKDAKDAKDRQERQARTVTPVQIDPAMEADRSSSESEKKAAAKRAKKKRQKQRKRAEAAAGAARSDAVPGIEEVETSPWSDPVPEIEEAPELDYDPRTEGIPD
jgi:hypothetical protein